MAAFNNQLMAQALRQRDPVQYPTGGGKVGRSLGESLAMAPQIQTQQQQPQQLNFRQMRENAEMMDKGIDKVKGWFGGGTTGADIGAGAQQYGPEVAKMGGNVTGGGGGGFMSGLSNLFGGGGGAGGVTASPGAGLAALAAAAYLGDKEMNESSGSVINADRLNDMGSVNGIGLRGGDLINGFNPATWASDPKKAAKGLGNAFTFGLMDKIF